MNAGRFQFDIEAEAARLLGKAPANASGDPTAVILTGGVAAGKTTLRKRDYSNGYVVLDAAEIFHHLSRGDSTIDFPGPLVDAIEAIGTLVADKALADRRDVVTELIGDTLEPIKELIDCLRALGYKVEVTLITCDLEESFRRAESRGDNVSAFYAEHFQRRWLINACKALIKARTS